MIKAILQHRGLNGEASSPGFGSSDHLIVENSQQFFNVWMVPDLLIPDEGGSPAGILVPSHKINNLNCS